jgi:peptidoglycan hydrolase CwlO-like protein
MSEQIEEIKSKFDLKLIIIIILGILCAAMFIFGFNGYNNFNNEKKELDAKIAGIDAKEKIIDEKIKTLDEKIQSVNDQIAILGAEQEASEPTIEVPSETTDATEVTDGLA